MPPKATYKKVVAIVRIQLSKIFAIDSESKQRRRLKLIIGSKIIINAI
jgi:hypothetical protein